MKPLLILILLFAPFSGIFSETEEERTPMDLKVGDEIATVKAVLGEPRGFMETGDFGIYYYKLGSVHFKAGKVVSLDLISEREYTERKEAETEAREKRVARGEKTLRAIREDEEFAALPAANRLAFWEQFRRDYPEVDIYLLYTRAKAEVETAREQQREKERIASLERRVLNAELQATRAQQAVEEQKLHNQMFSSRRLDPVIYYPQPVLYRRPVNKLPDNHPLSPEQRAREELSDYYPGGWKVKTRSSYGGGVDGFSLRGSFPVSGGEVRVQSNTSRW